MGIAGALVIVLLVKAFVTEQPMPNQVPMIEHGAINYKRIDEVAEKQVCMDLLAKGENPADINCEKYTYGSKAKPR